MSSVYSLTTKVMTAEQERSLYQELQTALGSTFRAFSMMFGVLPPEQCGGQGKDRILVYVCVPPYMEVSRRRTLVKDLCAAAERVFGPGAGQSVDVLFPYHDDENCGVHGVMRCDALAAQKAGRS